MDQVLEILSTSGLTLNTKKCVFGHKEIHFWGLIVSGDGVQPDPAKVEALDHITPPRNKVELMSFLCMMQSNSDFIPDFAKKAAKLRELTKKSIRFKWKKDHQECFKELIKAFKKETLLQYFDGNLQTFIFVDAHNSGLGAILAQGHSAEDARPVAISSRTTNEAEKHYPQLDLEGTSIDFGLRRFREYLVGSPHTVKVITDHKPLVPIFNKNRKGSVRTQRIRLRHQDIPYVVEYRKGKLNQSDYVSRHSKPLSKIVKEERKECEEFNNLLYTLHSTPVMDHIGLSRIAKETAADPTLTKIQNYVRSGQNWIPKEDGPEIKKFKQILPELTITGNGILLKDDRIILPDNLQRTAIELAHRGAHPGQSGMERRLRHHFFFHNLYKKVEKFVKECNDCSVYVDKKTKEPINHHKVPTQCWDTVAVDLFGPMPSSNHIVVVHDLASRFPAAKLVSSTKADKVIPALGEIYDAFGNPEVQISDNGTPFNSKKMVNFAAERDIQLRHTPPLHPNANPAETFMKPIGKALKISGHHGLSEKQALQSTLNNYRQTPHPATGVAPANMLFRDGIKSQFPRKPSSNDDIASAKQRDLDQKKRKQDEVNESKYRKSSCFKTGDRVLVRNYKKTSKFDPLFIPNPYEIIDINNEAKKLTLKICGEKDTLIRHPDDVKPYMGGNNFQNKCDVDESCRENPAERELLLYNKHEEEQAGDTGIEIHETPDDHENLAQDDEQHVLRRSTRQRFPNSRYVNAEFVSR